jgi:Surface antigen.
MEGTMHSVLGTAGLSTLERRGRGTVGWNVFASLERGGDAFGGDFNFTQAVLDVRRFQPLSEYDKINFRVRVGSLQGDYIPQKSFEIGGANTLPAYGFKEFAGNRMLLGNFEYVLGGRLMDDEFFWPNSLNFIVLADAGATSLVSTKKIITEGFSSINLNTIKSDIGFAVGWHDESWRLGFAWRTDVKSPVSVFLRFNKPF